MKKSPHLSVIIPAYNEEENIAKDVLKPVIAYLKKQSYTWELLLVDDGSTDNTTSLLSTFARKHSQVTLIKNTHMGKAGTVTRGVRESTGAHVLFTDFDQATPISETKKMLSGLKKADVVIGSRAGNRDGAPISRLIMARGFMLLRSLILGINVRDTQCGFKAFTRTAADDLFNQLQLYDDTVSHTGSRVTAGFDVELLYLAKKSGYSIKEIPVQWHYVETRRVNPIRDSIDGLRDLLRIRLLDIKGSYTT